MDRALNSIPWIRVRSLYISRQVALPLSVIPPTFPPSDIVKSHIHPIPSHPIRSDPVPDPIRISIHSSSSVLLTRMTRMTMEREGDGEGKELWVFAYGSLVWNPGFDFDERIIGFIRDYRRVFDLACFDHRGTPEKPARTCTLEAKEGELCWGAAYCVRGDAERQKEAMQYLQRRECEYDNIAHVDFYKEGETLKPAVTGVQVFVSTPDPVGNKYYLGPAPLQEMALQIATANGPCGNNRDYVFLLEKALSDIGHEDDYVMELAKEVRKCLQIPKGDISPSHVSRQLPSLHLRSLPETPVAVDS